MLSNSQKKANKNKAWELLTHYLIVALDCLSCIISKAHAK